MRVSRLVRPHSRPRHDNTPTSPGRIPQPPPTAHRCPCTGNRGEALEQQEPGAFPPHTRHGAAEGRRSCALPRGKAARAGSSYLHPGRVSAGRSGRPGGSAPSRRAVPAPPWRPLHFRLRPGPLLRHRRRKRGRHRDSARGSYRREEMRCRLSGAQDEPLGRSLRGSRGHSRS